MLFSILNVIALSSEAGIPVYQQLQANHQPSNPISDIQYSGIKPHSKSNPHEDATEESPMEDAEFGPMSTSEAVLPVSPEPQPEGQLYEEECEEEVIDTCGDESKYPIDEDCIEDVYEDCEGDTGEWNCIEEEYIECDDSMEPIGEYEEDCEEVVVEDQCAAEPEPEMHTMGGSGVGLEAAQETGPASAHVDEL